MELLRVKNNGSQDQGSVKLSIARIVWFPHKNNGDNSHNGDRSLFFRHMHFISCFVQHFKEIICHWCQNHSRRCTKMAKEWNVIFDFESIEFCLPMEDRVSKICGAFFCIEFP